MVTVLGWLVVFAVVLSVLALAAGVTSAALYVLWHSVRSAVDTVVGAGPASHTTKEI
jgi:hypothetical protein